MLLSVQRGLPPCVPSTGRGTPVAASERASLTTTMDRPARERVQSWIAGRFVRTWGTGGWNAQHDPESRRR